MRKLLLVPTICCILCGPLFAAADDFPVSIQIDAAKTEGKLEPIWRFFGYDEADFTYMKDGQKLLSQISELQPPQVYIRAHHLMTSGDGVWALKWSSTNMYSVDAQGKPVYNWTIIDRIFDTYVQRHLKPYVEIGFMPKDLSTHPELYPTKFDPNQRVKVDAGQAYPPKDYGAWGELVYQWANHCVQRYGKDEVGQWYWECWNEPDISYWKGTQAEYFKLYDYAVDGVRRALPAARVGGPDDAGNTRFLRSFINHCLHDPSAATGKQDIPLDFLSFHAKGSPSFVGGHVRLGVSNELARIDNNFAVIASFPETKNLPVVIGECDPDGSAATPATELPQNGYRYGTMFSSYTAEAFGRIHQLAAKHGTHLLGALTWSFEMENKPYFAGYRTLATNGIDMPVFNVFRMFSKMAGTQLEVQSSADLSEATIQGAGVRAKPDVFGIAGLEDKKLSVMVWHYHDDDLPGPAAAVDLSLSDLPLVSGDAKVTHYRIDQDHSNSYTVWKSMNRTQNPTPDQYKQLEAAGQLATMDDLTSVHIDGRKADLKFTLPRQGVSLLILEWK